MKDLSWMAHPAMKNIDAKKLAILVEFVNAAEGKSPSAAFPILMQTQNKMKEQGMTFTAEETDLMVSILTKDMTPAEKIKFENMKKIIEKYSAGKKK